MGVSIYCSEISSFLNFVLKLQGSRIHKGLLYTGKYGSMYCSAVFFAEK